MESLADRIASMRFAVVLLAEVMEVQGLATRTEIRDMLGTAATKPKRAATVAKALSASSQRVEELEGRATKERWLALQVVRPDTPVGHRNPSLHSRRRTPRCGHVLAVFGLGAGDQVR
jgi:hypothetical protein